MAGGFGVGCPPSVIAVTDVTGLRDHPSRRGPVELRLDELFPDRSVHRRAARHLDVEFGGTGALATRKEAAAELESAYPDEPDPFAIEHSRPDEARAKRTDPEERRHDAKARDGRLRRLTAVVQVGRWRIDPERRGAIAVMAAVLVAALAVGWQALASRPQAEPVSDSASVALVASTRASAAISGGGATATADGRTSSSAAAKVIVDVVGRVHRPGLVTLPAGARVADAVRAAGGALTGTNLSSINLARVCVDGEQIAVGVTGAAAPPGTSGPAPGAGAPAGLVNLNTATADQLDALPGVGPVMAQRIIAYRTDHGPFTAVSQLQQVSGIGDARYADLSPLVTV